MSKEDYLDINNNKSICKEVEKREPTIRNCIGCGRCVATCEAAINTDFSLRDIIYRIRRENIININKLTRYCTFCAKCYNVCPQGVNTRNIILVINELSYKIKR